MFFIFRIMLEEKEACELTLSNVHQHCAFGRDPDMEAARAKHSRIKHFLHLPGV